MGGKPHQGHPRKVVEHGRVCARTKTHIPKSVVMALCGRKALGISQEHPNHRFQLILVSCYNKTGHIYYNKI